MPVEWVIGTYFPVCIAVCSGGASLVNPRGAAASFRQLLDQLPSGLEFIVAVICGNDFRPSSWAVVVGFLHPFCRPMPKQPEANSTIKGVEGRVIDFLLLTRDVFPLVSNSKQKAQLRREGSQQMVW